MRFFKWIAEVLADPNDKQGSTQRVCLMVLVLTVCSLLLLIGVGLSPLKDVPVEMRLLVTFLAALLVGGIAWAKGVAGTVAIKAPPPEGAS